MAVSTVDRIDDDEIIELTRRLVQFNTVNPPGNEEAAIRFLGDYLAEHGLAVAYQPVAPGRPNLIARLPGSGAAGHLVLSGHMDVVPLGTEAWQHDPFGAEVVDGRMYGRGTADMKSGVAAMAGAMLALARAGFRPRSDLILAISSGEEVDGLGAAYMVSSGVLAGSAYLVLAEFSGLDVYIAHKGYHAMNVTAHGKAAHSAMPHLGVNAIAYMARVIDALQANPFPFERHDILGEPTVGVTVIAGGEKVNVIPDRCSIAVNIRTVPGQTADDLVARTRRLLDDVAREMGLAVRTEVTMELSRDPVITARDDPLVRAAVEAVTATRGIAPAVTGVSYGTDAVHLTPAYGLSTIICGPGHFAQAHQVDEYVAVAELLQAARIYADLAERMLD